MALGCVTEIPKSSLHRGRRSSTRVQEEVRPALSEHGRCRLLYTIALLALQPELPPVVLATVTKANDQLHALARWCLYDLARDSDVKSKATTIFSLGVLSRLQLIPQEYPHQQWPDKSVRLSTIVRRSASELDVARSLEKAAQPQHDNYQLDRQVKVVDLVRLSIGLELLQI
ncbi:hypothetical protein FOZ62_017188, partial [Perkinsus olseni]